MPGTHPHKTRRFTRLIIAIGGAGLSILVVLWVMYNRGEIPVLNGYFLARPESRSVWLCDPRGTIIVTEQIDLIGTHRDTIVGRVVDAGEWAYPQYPKFPTGYFVVNTSNGELRSGLTASERDELLGSPAPPLHAPMKWAIWHW